jgi:hypothetical protein
VPTIQDVSPTRSNTSPLARRFTTGRMTSMASPDDGRLVLGVGNARRPVGGADTSPAPPTGGRRPDGVAARRRPRLRARRLIARADARTV